MAKEKIYLNDLDMNTFFKYFTTQNVNKSLNLVQTYYKRKPLKVTQTITKDGTISSQSSLFVDNLVDIDSGSSDILDKIFNTIRNSGDTINYTQDDSEDTKQVYQVYKIPRLNCIIGEEYINDVLPKYSNYPFLVFKNTEGYPCLFPVTKVVSDTAENYFVVDALYSGNGSKYVYYKIVEITSPNEDFYSDQSRTFKIQTSINNARVDYYLICNMAVINQYEEVEDLNIITEKYIDVYGNVFYERNDKSRFETYVDAVRSVCYGEQSVLDQLKARLPANEDLYIKYLDKTSISGLTKFDYIDIFENVENVADVELLEYKSYPRKIEKIDENPYGIQLTPADTVLTEIFTPADLPKIDLIEYLPTNFEYNSKTYIRMINEDIPIENGKFHSSVPKVHLATFYTPIVIIPGISYDLINDFRIYILNENYDYTNNVFTSEPSTASFKYYNIQTTPKAYGSGSPISFILNTVSKNTVKLEFVTNTNDDGSESFVIWFNGQKIFYDIQLNESGETFMVANGAKTRVYKYSDNKYYAYLPITYQAQRGNKDKRFVDLSNFNISSGNLLYKNNSYSINETEFKITSLDCFVNDGYFNNIDGNYYKVSDNNELAFFENTEFKPIDTQEHQEHLELIQTLDSKFVF